MNLLFVVPYTPTLIRVRPYNFVRALARRGHRLTLATLFENDEEARALDELRGWGIEVLARPLTRGQKLRNAMFALPGRDPVQASFCYQPALAEAVRQRACSGAFDAVHVEHLRGSGYALAARDAISAGPRKIPVVWDSVDSITYLFEQSARQSGSFSKRLMTWIDLARTRSYEGWLIRQFDHTVVTSRIDRDALLKIARARPSPITVVSNGVDLDTFTPGDATREPDTLIFSGKMSYHANITAVLHLVRDIMPAVWARRPAVRLTIVGKDPSPEVLALARTHPGRVLVTGSVPDLAAHLRKASVAVVPIVYGAGVQNKVLEAMATCTPVVASLTAVAALDESAGLAMRIARDDGAFAAHVLSLLENEADRRLCGEAGRAFVERHHAWDASAAALETLYMTEER